MEVRQELAGVNQRLDRIEKGIRQLDRRFDPMSVAVV